PNVVYSAKSHQATMLEPAGALVYLRTEDDVDALVWVDAGGRIVSQSEHAILKAAECVATTPPAPRAPNHHELTQKAVAHVAQSQPPAGQLGRPSGARFRTYERLRSFAERNAQSLWVTDTLHKAIEQML
ncbi:MAG: NgoFVII family restriction endonuclease, partial [Anaerolineae bacterium]|nr:NgoFVII family restriction endonuclease [Anaerolineae bacterium]